MAGLKNRSYADGELLAAVFALVQAVTYLAVGGFLLGFGGNTFQVVGIIQRTAGSADRAVWPEHTFNVRKGCGFILHVVGIQHRHFSIAGLTSILRL